MTNQPIIINREYRFDSDDSSSSGSFLSAENSRPLPLREADEDIET